MALAPVLAAAGGQLPEAELSWQRVLENRQRLQEQQRQRQAMAMLFSSLTTPIDGALPQQGPPAPQPQQPQPQVASGPMLRTQPAPFGQRPTDAALASAGSPPAAAQPPASAGGAAPGPAPAPAGGGALSLTDPVARLRQMAQRLKQANPGVDNLTLATALQQQVEMARGLGAEDRAILQAETRVMQIQAQADNSIRNANSREDVARIRADTAQQIADTRVQAYRDAFATASADRRYGVDKRAETADTAETGRNTRADAAETGRNSRASARIDASAASAQEKGEYKSIANERQAILDEARSTAGIPTADQSKRLRAVNDKMIAYQKQHPRLPRPTEVAGGSGAPAKLQSQPGGGAGGPMPSADGGLPSDLPSPKGLAEGTRARDDSGNVVAVVKGGAWAAP